MNRHPPSSNLHLRRILVRGVNWLGDAVMTTPALLRLREKFPEACISLLTPEKLADLWKNHPAIDEVISFTGNEGLLDIAKRLRAESGCEGIRAGTAAYGKTMTSGQTLAEAMTQLAQQVPKQPIELALVLPNSPRSALEVFFARIPRRIGYARPWRNFLFTQTIAPRAAAVKMRKLSVGEIKQLVAADVSRRQTSVSQVQSVSRVLTNTATSAHQIHEYLHLAAALGANPEPLPPQLFVTLEEIGAAKKKFGLEDQSGPIFGLNSGAEYGPAKRWPLDRFIAAAREIHRRTHCFWLLFGGKSDVNLTGQIAGALQASGIMHHDLAGQTTLRELMVLLKLCRVLLTNDTGPMHVAAALGTPVVVPFGSTSPELTGPGLPGDPRHRLLKSAVPCSPCFLRQCPIDFRCLQGIGVDQVMEAVGEVLQREA